MDEPQRVALAAGLALLLSLLATPVARKVALRTEFLDHPRDYKKHSRSTPYLGGSAVMAAWAMSGAAFGHDLGEYWPVLAGAAVMWAAGTIDDRRGLSVGLRLILQSGVALLLWTTDLGWDLTGGEALDLGLTVLWVVGLTNSANLMDNQDGAAASTALVAAAGIGLLAASEGEPAVGALALALAGACGGFLPYNLASPSKIFLGDGGSAPVGFVLAACTMSIPSPVQSWVGVLAAVPLVGVFIFDTTLVVVSRLRRGAPVLSGGRDHLSHRLLRWFGSPIRVAWVLAGTQALAACVGAILYSVSESTLELVAAAYLAGAATLLVALELAMAGNEAANPAKPHAAEEA